MDPLVHSRVRYRDRSVFRCIGGHCYRHLYKLCIDLDLRGLKVVRNLKTSVRKRDRRTYCLTAYIAWLDLEGSRVDLVSVRFHLVGQSEHEFIPCVRSVHVQICFAVRGILRYDQIVLF